MAHISAERKSEIESAVEQTKLDTGFTYPENNILDIADALKLEVLDMNLPDFMERKVKAFLTWFSSDEAATSQPYIGGIYLNSSLPEDVKNFAVAHEMGHFLLHRSNATNRSKIDFLSYSGIADPDNLESEANYFAGYLLMPAEKLEASMRYAKNLDDVAKGFGVSRAAVESRLRGLGWSLI